MRVKPETNLLDPVPIAKWLIERQFIRQMRLKSLHELSRLARDLGVGLSPWDDKDVQHLWQLGILRADYLISRHPLDIEGIVFIEQTDRGEHLYADIRNFLGNAAGLGNVIEGLGPLPEDVYLLFHAFRYYVLYQIEQELTPRLDAFQLLRSITNYRNTVEQFLISVNKEASDERFQERVRRWNEIVSLAVAVEPFTFNRLFGYYGVPVTYDNNEEGFYKTLRKQYEDSKTLLLRIGLEGVMEVLTELCREAERLQPNKDIRRLVRLTKRYGIEHVKGTLGGSSYLLSMAEMIRRAAENVFETELPEEDELGLSGGSETADYKEYHYGSARLLDSHEAKSTFIQSLNLDYTVRLRWYVEGDTELYALRSELSGDQEIEILNLRGEVLAGKSKGLSFRDNLMNDMRRSIYSFVYLDGDVENNRRVLLRAVENREMFGMFFLSTPDFEFANFNADELATILWEMALEKGAPPDKKEDFLKLACDAQNAKELFLNANKALTNLRLDKGKTWGERLLRFARENVYLQSNGVRQTRPIIEAIMLARHAIDCGYYLSKESGRVDLNSGKIVGVKKYFAYGSNLLKRRLDLYAPSALVRATGYITGYKVRFNKRSIDGSGKCNVVKTEDDKDRVYGVVYDFLDADKRDLDKHEGLGKGYHAEEIRVTTDNGEIGCYTYIADGSSIDDSLKPYSWYKDFVVEGARQHRLPDEYVTALEATEAATDADAEREKGNRQLLGHA